MRDLFKLYEDFCKSRGILLFGLFLKGNLSDNSNINKKNY